MKERIRFAILRAWLWVIFMAGIWERIKREWRS